MTPRQVQRALALTLAVATLIAFSMPPAWAGGIPFQGRVVQSDGITPRSGAVVHLVGQGKTGYRSDPTGADGDFRVDGAPAGRYNLVVETDDGAFMYPERVAVAKDAEPLALALQPGANYQQTQASGLGGKGGLPTWAKWTITGGIIAIGLFAIYEVSKDEEDNSSPFGTASAP